MADPETLNWQATRERTLWLSASLGLVLIPHMTRMPLWVSACFVALAFWRIEHVFRGVKLPGRWTRLALSIAIVVGTYLSYGTVFGRSAGIAALAALAGMKLLETDTSRDAHAVVFLSFFLVITNFLYSQSIATGLYMLLVVVVSGATLMSINSEEPGLQIVARLRFVTRLLLQAAPLILVMFVLFPRIPGPLWGLPKDAHSANSGLGDSMSPGAISRVSLSPEVAFRVQFDGPMPPSSKLYWRGPVFIHTDGKTWSGDEPQGSRRIPDLQEAGRALYYTLTMEPHSQPWIFGLDVPATIQPDVRMTEDYQLLSTRRVRERKRFRLRSFPRAQMTHITGDQRLAALALPKGAHPATRRLAERWRAESPDDEAVVMKALNYFRTRSFYYTLRPPVLTGDPVDQFLFQSRRGFCEYYASAFSVLMRAAGIPTRVVTGYQGGDINPLGDYVIVRQRDAHAWAEVWLNDKGWVRVDPTAAVSPERIELGMDGTLPTPIGPAAFGLEASGSVASFFKRLRHGWDTVSTSWNQWVLGYGPKRQNELLASLGLAARDWRTLLIVLLISLAVAFAAVALVLSKKKRSADRITRAYERFCTKLARRGVKRRDTEGPADYAARVGNARPDLRQAVREIADQYVRLRYANASADIVSFEKAVTAFRA